VLTIFPAIGETEDGLADLQWYRWWLNQQFAALPATECPLLPEPTGNLEIDCLRMDKLFIDVANSLKSQSEPSIDHIIDDLVLQKPLNQTLDEDSLNTCRELVFAILDWQTMLFQPSFGTSPPQRLSVVDDFDGVQGQAFMAFKQRYVRS